MYNETASRKFLKSHFGASAGVVAAVVALVVVVARMSISVR